MTEALSYAFWLLAGLAIFVLVIVGIEWLARTMIDWFFD